MTLAAAAALAPGGLDDLSRAGLDVVTLVALVGLFYRRHRRQDLVAVYVAFNVGLYAILTFLAGSTLSAGVGFGVFGVLSIIRLRSEEYNNVEMAYFFLSLATALVNALPGRPFLLSLAMDIAILMTMFAVDFPRVGRRTEFCRVILDRVYDDPSSMRMDLELRLQATLESVNVTAIDYVRETTAVDIRYQPYPTHARVRT
jgi:Domain of unknown function (DUF4956)